ncbi:MAG: hypothetical protein EBU90_28455 [Proteobacteria bacterium]|nr:hypothetical protein [Pseudomonadota bacterium]
MVRACHLPALPLFVHAAEPSSQAPPLAQEIIVQDQAGCSHDADRPAAAGTDKYSAGTPARFPGRKQKKAGGFRPPPPGPSARAQVQSSAHAANDSALIDSV